MKNKSNRQNKKRQKRQTHQGFKFNFDTKAIQERLCAVRTAIEEEVANLYIKKEK